MDPQIQVAVRRVLAARRALSKNPQMEKLMSDILHLYSLESEDKEWLDQGNGEEKHI